MLWFSGKHAITEGDKVQDDIYSLLFLTSKQKSRSERGDDYWNNGKRALTIATVVYHNITG